MSIANSSLLMLMDMGVLEGSFQYKSLGRKLNVVQLNSQIQTILLNSWKIPLFRRC